MKNLITFLFLVFSTGSFCLCQTKIIKYCTIACGGRKPYIDYVSADSVLMSYDSIIQNDLAGVRAFKSTSGILNYMDHKGWTLISESVGFQYNSITKLFFKKEFGQ